MRERTRLGHFGLLLALCFVAFLSLSEAKKKEKFPNPRELACETCQAITYLQSENYAKQPKGTYQGALFVAAESIFDPSEPPGNQVCQFNTLSSYASTSTPKHDVSHMMQVCDTLMTTLADRWIELFASGKSEKEIRERVCVAKDMCTQERLWQVQDYPENRPGSILYNTREGEKYREVFKKEEGVIETKDGLLYKVLEKGDDSQPSPTETDRVLAHYTGWLVDGTEFDSSSRFQRGAEFPVDGVIRGWRLALLGMKVNEKRKLVIPPVLGYGIQPMGDKIPANSTLIFEMQLAAIQPKTSKPNMRQEL